MPHVLLAIEWLAKLHGLTYVARKRFEKYHPNEDWQAKNPDFPNFRPHFDPERGHWGQMGKIPQFSADLAENWCRAMFLPTMKIAQAKNPDFPIF